MSYLKKLTHIKNNNKHIFLIILVFLLCLYFSYYTIYGKNGIYDYFKIRSEIQDKRKIKDKLENALESQREVIDSIKVDNLDLDLLDEQTRKNLGYAKDDEVIIYENY
jgi:cell division protein FtsB